MLYTKKLTNNSQPYYSLVAFTFVIIFVGLLIPSITMAAEVKSVQIGTTTVSAKSASVAITPVTDNKSILIFNLTTHSTTSGPESTHLRGQLSCNSGTCNAIDFERYGTASFVTVRWQVLEFTNASAVDVQRGITTQSVMSGSPPSTTIATGVNSAKSFVLLSEFVHGSVTSDDDFTRGQINGAGNLVLTVGERKTSASQAEIAWQVVEYQDATIQQGDVIFSTTNASKTISISNIDVDKSLLLYNYYSTGKSSDNPVCQNLVSGQVDNATTLQFNRGCANHNGELHLTWFVIEFTDASTVQHNSVSLTSSQLSKTVTLPNAVDTSCAITTTGYHQRGGQSAATVDHTSSAWFNAGLNASGTELTLTRGQTNGVSAETGWSVVEFNGCGTTCPVPPPTFSCDQRFYITSSSNSSLPSQLSNVDNSSIPFTLNSIGNTTHGNNYNAVGYRIQDNYLYGIKLVTNRLLRISADGSTKNLGAVSGLPAPPDLNSSYDAGDVFPDGYLYIHQAGSHAELYKIDVTSSPPTVVQTITLNQSIWLSDIVYNKLDNKVYGMGDQGEKFMIDPATWTVSTVGTNAAPASYGAAYSDTLGNVYIYRNNPGTFFLVDFGINGTGSGTMTALSTAPNVKFNDGASCRSTSPFKDFSDAPASYGSASHVLSSRVYLGASVPDIENAAQPTANADGDDNNSNDDEDSVTSFPTLRVSDTDYTLAVNCAGNGVVAGWIDFNKNGVFDITERNANHPINCVGTTASLTWSALTGLSEGTVLVRLRTASAQSDVDSAIGDAADGEAEDHTLNIISAGCDALSGHVNAGLSPNGSLTSGDRLFLGSTTLSDETGHLEAFAVDATGVPTGAALWDAATVMTATDRANNLYSSDASGGKELFANLLAPAFATDATLVTTIKATIQAAALGALSPASELALITKEMDVLTYMNNTQYRTFYTSKVATRNKRILASSDDGFLYAFNQSDGDLGWGWMPRSLVSALQNPDTFRDQHLMQGTLDIIDAKDASSNYRSYITGSYKQGLGQYVLRLSDDTASDLDDVVWDVDLSSSKVSAPNNGQRAYFQDSSETSYSVFVASGNAVNSSTLYIYSLNATTTPLAIPLGFNATASPYIMADSRNAFAKQLYLGDANGNIYSAALLQSDGTLQTSTSLVSDLTSSITALDTSDSSPVLFIGGASSSSPQGRYLRAQSADRLTVFAYDSNNSTWLRTWTSYVGSAHRWTGGNMVEADSSITALPTGATLSDEAYIVANSIVLPVVEAPTSNACDGLSYYYFYKLTDGHFPTRTFYTTNSEITAKLALGIGKAETLHFANLVGSENMIGLGMAAQKIDNTTGINASFWIKDSFTTGIRSWRELRHH